MVNYLKCVRQNLPTKLMKILFRKMRLAKSLFSEWIKQRNSLQIILLIINEE